MSEAAPAAPIEKSDGRPGAQALSGRHAAVTGASRGIGAAVAGELARLGAAVTLIGRDEAALEQQRAALDAAGARVAIRQLDLEQTDAIAPAFEQAAADLGAIDILVNNAGIAPSAPLEKLELAHWRQTFEINVTAPFVACQAVLGGMRQAGWGRIVNVASTAGLIGYPYVAGYVASKHGLIGLTRALALEVAKQGITVNAVCPGYTETDIAESAIANIMSSGKTEAEARAILARGNPQGRLIQPAEVAQSVGWLCLPGSSAITGQAIAVAGGEVF